ncbi:MAG: TIGR00730 family Rossman fold protein [Bacteroidales bacterium]|nr:TIGR00730 family Rossman fold protein [Bacteroidales bacterium]
MTKSVCVFCSSSEDLQKGYYDFAEKFGKILAENNFTIYHGGGIIGLMGAMMRGAYEQGGAKIIGVVPEKLHREGIVSDEMQKLVITDDMKERKSYLREHADSFAIMPGAFGTMDEMFEILTLKQLKYHNKAIVILNFNHFFDDMLRQMDKFFDEGFTISNYRTTYYVCETPEEAVEYLKNYKPTHIYDKYLKE